MAIYLPAQLKVYFSNNRVVNSYNVNITSASTNPWVTIPISTGTASASVTPVTATVPTMTTAATGDTWDNWIRFHNNQIVTYANTWQDEVWDAWGEDEAQLVELQQQRDELQARREQQSRERLAADQERARNMLVAHDRALDLLDDLVTEEERVPGLDMVQVRGSDGQLYRLEMHRRTVHGNIVRVDEHGCILGRACVAPGMYGDTGVLPTGDGWVGQYLGLKFDTERFLSHANWSGVRRCQVQQAAA